MCARRISDIDQVAHVVATNRQMLEKALLMRAQSYLADVKAQLLTGVIYEIDSSRKRLLTAHERLRSSMHTLSLQKELLAMEVKQRHESEQSAHRDRLQAELANRTRARFLANITHDVLTLLNAIKAHAEMISRETLGPLEPEGYKNYANDIGLASEQLHELIRSLLETARVEAGQLEVAAGSIDLIELLREMLAIVAHKAKEKGVALPAEIGAETLPIFADPILLRRLMLDLMTNALEFTDAGGRVDILAEADANGGATIRFTDTGPGIAPEDLEMVLVPFGQIGDKSVDPDASQGLGLGLPMAKAIAEAHGGALTIESEVGTGTTVTVHLPLKFSGPEND
ncbi:MAG: HAMP domain-containing sensor histidine kinase [Alphaproteobacteria bacterium]|nr:HAMP domain-containing sensor histidine kinase [Alphaproteobacteria bacterium]